MKLKIGQLLVAFDEIAINPEKDLLIQSDGSVETYHESYIEKPDSIYEIDGTTLYDSLVDYDLIALDEPHQITINDLDDMKTFISLIIYDLEEYTGTEVTL
ncbi:hypothetical protein QP168_09120 [Aerococcus urinae]|uniref:Uncharacterized protein n=1 Tax=Aerococcus mictus TaxID=2976810 RepID=A0A1E9PPL5_9LACT|nr:MULTISPECIES: hypothetical protein [Aerococcus]KAA9290011.1 hypothetical protein F6I06_09090 [Aerococcus mictus]MBU5611228.1 hypothetical protein [Aerococcus urinae]MCY3064963.1 hypothetical protein [Aerococcus mictus]MCY3076214.1 hypothetical protein [Aerococcus mictus]MCY3081413.1 hypothetical protein [Aerococcus mictus]